MATELRLSYRTRERRSASRRRRRRYPSSAVRLALPLGLTLGLCLPVAALVRPDGIGPPEVRWALELAAVPDGGWPGGWSEAAQTAASLQGRAFERALAFVAGLALLAWLAALAGTVLGSLRVVAAARDELALRSAVGATNRQLRTEVVRAGARTALLACGAGGLVAAAMCEVLAHGLPENVRVVGPTGAMLLSSSGLVPVVLLLSAFAVTVTPLLVLPGAVPPMRRVARSRLARRHATGRERGSDAVRSLAVCQIAACLGIATCGMLLSGGASEVENPANRYSHARDTLVLRVRLPGTVVREEAWSAVREVLAGLPGFRAAALSTPGAVLGLGTVDRGGSDCAGCGGGGMAAPVTFGRARHIAVDANFFDVLGVDVEVPEGSNAGGAELERRAIDGPAAPRDEPAAVVIDRVFLRQWFQGTSAVGRRVWLRGTPPFRGPGHRVIGVVNVQPPVGLREAGEPVPAVYLPFSAYAPEEADIAVRGAVSGGVPVERLADTAVAAIATAVPGAQARVLGRLDRLLAARIAPVRWLARLTLVLAAAAFVLAVLGCTSAMVEHVWARASEIGLRRAVGARRRDVVRLVLTDTGKLMLIGAYVGTAFGASANRAVPALVEGLEPLRLEAIGVLLLLLVLVGLAGAAAAAVRAARLDPVEALRH